MKSQNKNNVKSKQNANEKNNKQKNKNIKKKKDNTKSSIDNPFSLDWPAIDYGNYSQLVSCLKQSFADYLVTLKRTEESEENTKLDVIKDQRNYTKYLLSKADPTCIIFGYNAVMRGLEKGKIQAVLVNADATPNMLIKSFIPVCNLRSKPLIPVKNLSHIFTDVRIKSTIAVGFTLSACKKEGPFHNLHTSCCKALGYDESREDLLSNKEATKPIGNKQDQLENSKKDRVNLISSYHLKRENGKDRVFKPSKTENPFEEPCIKLDKSDSLKLFTNLKSKLSEKRKDDDILKWKTKPTLPEVSESSFYIDVSNDDVDSEEEERSSVVDKGKPLTKEKLPTNKRSTARYFDALNNSSNNSDYIPAKIRKIKPSNKKHPCSL